MTAAGAASGPKLLIYDVGYGPRPAWYLPRLCPTYQVQVLWTASGIAARDQARAQAFEAWCAHRPLGSRDTAAAELLAVARSWQPAGITTFGELAVTEVHRLAGALGLPANEPRSLPALRNKYEQRRLLAAAGVPVPRFARVRDRVQLEAALATVGLPAVLKPVAGAGSMATFSVDGEVDPAALWAAAEAAYAGDSRTAGSADFVLEEFLVGHRLRGDERYSCQVSVESLVQDGAIQHLAVADTLAQASGFREVGHLVPSTLPAELLRELRSAAGAAIAAIGITNSAVHTELMLTAAGPRIIEVNSRIGGGRAELLHYGYGYDVIAQIAAIATGRKVSPIGEPRCHVAFLTPQAPGDPTRLTAVPSADELTRLPGVVEAGVNYAVGDTPAPHDGTRGGTLARIVAVADRREPLVELAAAIAGNGYFRYAPSGTRDG